MFIIHKLEIVRYILLLPTHTYGKIIFPWIHYFQHFGKFTAFTFSHVLFVMIHVIPNYQVSLFIFYCFRGANFQNFEPMTLKYRSPNSDVAHLLYIININAKF